jgi:ribosomal protein L33
MIPQWIEAEKVPSATKFICPHCRETVYFSHGSSSKSRKHGITKRCLYRFCPWCGKEVEPLRINYIIRTVEE